MLSKWIESSHFEPKAALQFSMDSACVGPAEEMKSDPSVLPLSL